ncbi:MAG TPA: TonB family protein [Accumulibacter sp.]|nr:TonB family protein [Accumulibacter sp.]HMW17638.1 TonB family protein [Accumulibacter sp.]HMY05498.1 TonB family protein [Accumulibacter sp.]HNG37735.1 TonB family protein [Accumulibacter sp.]HNL77087.1 TonB family protein [Accumulibacter sp.]
MRLALVGSLGLHLMLLVLLSGPGHVGGGDPFATGESLAVAKATLRLNGRLQASQRVLSPVEPVVIEPSPSLTTSDPAIPRAEIHPNNQTPLPEKVAETPLPVVADHVVEQAVRMAPAQPDAAFRPPSPAPPTSPAPPAPPATAADSPDALPSQETVEAAARRAGYLPTSLLDSKAGPLSEIVIEYPESAGGQSGRVVLQLFIDEYGVVREVLVSQAIPSGFFEQAAISAFSRARFSPALRGGRPVKSQMRVEVDFSVLNRPTPTSGKAHY